MRERALVLLVGAYALAQVLLALLFVHDRAPGTDGARTGLPLDDAWIHLVYARSLSAFEGFAYNEGVAEAGSTSPLWSILLAPLFWLRLPWDISLVAFVKAIGVVCGVCTSVFAHLLASKLSRTPRAGLFAGAVAGLATSLDASLAFARVSGMEVPLATALLLAAFFFLAAGRDLLAGLAFALGLLARPELGVAVGCAVGIAFYDRRRRADLDGKVRARGERALFLPTAAVLLLVVGYCLHVAGRPAPNTFYAKYGAFSALERLSDLGTVLSALESTTFLRFGAYALLACAGAWWLLASRASPPSSAVYTVARSFPIATLSLLLSLLWVHHIAQAEPFYWQRYLLPLVPPLLVLAAIAVGACADRGWEILRGEAPRSALPVILCVAGLVLAAAPLPVLPASLSEASARYASNCENINEMQVQIALWLRDNAAEGTWIATHDAGALRFLSGHPVLDLAGLNEHRMGTPRAPEAMREAQPRYFVIFPSWSPSLMRNPAFKEVLRVSAKRYTICDCDQREMVVLDRAGGG